MSRKKIIIEDKIPYIRGIFDDVAEVRYLPAVSITADALIDADALITRTRPKLDEALLKNSRLKIIATATIGTDHIDTNYCNAKDIRVYNAPGCNAPAVAQWVYAAILNLIDARDIPNLTLGIVGVGHVGRIVELWGRKLGFKILLNDPPRALAEGDDEFMSLAELAHKSDIITFHTPLEKAGKFPTYHLADKSFFDSLQRTPLILNASRGPVVDNEALIEALDTDKVRAAAIDCWEGEPGLSLSLLDRVTIATPHIAGYSIEGKIRATIAAVEAVSKELHITPVSVPPFPAVNFTNVTAERIIDSYDIKADSRKLKNNPEDFEPLRDHYALRHEV